MPKTKPMPGSDEFWALPHKERFERVLRSAASTSVSVSAKDAARAMEAQGLRFVVGDTSVEYWDEVSQTWYEPITGTIRRYPTMFDFQREQQGAEWPHEKLEARWREICAKQTVK